MYCIIPTTICLKWWIPFSSARKLPGIVNCCLFFCRLCLYFRSYMISQLQRVRKGQSRDGRTDPHYRNASLLKGISILIISELTVNCIIRLTCFQTVPTLWDNYYFQGSSPHLMYSRLLLTNGAVVPRGLTWSPTEKSYR